MNKLAAIPKTDKFAIVQKETELLLKVIQSDTKCPKDHLKFDLNTYGVQSICYWAGATADYSELTSQLPSSVATIQHDFTEKEAQITEGKPER